MASDRRQDISMGTYGTALYSDDTACEARDDFVHLLGRLRDPAHATAALLELWSDRLDDVDEGPVFWLALADTQWKYGCLEDGVRRRALDVIDGEHDLRRWDGAARAKRHARLLTLKDTLLTPPPKPRMPRPRRLPEVPATRVPSPDGTALATAFTIGAQSPPTAQVMVEMQAADGRGGGGVFSADCHVSELQLAWRDAETLCITYPAHARVTRRSESTFYSGRTIHLVYCSAPAPREPA